MPCSHNSVYFQLTPQLDNNGCQSSCIGFEFCGAVLDTHLYVFQDECGTRFPLQTKMVLQNENAGVVRYYSYFYNPYASFVPSNYGRAQ